MRRSRALLQKSAQPTNDSSPTDLSVGLEDEFIGESVKRTTESKILEYRSFSVVRFADLLTNEPPPPAMKRWAIFIQSAPRTARKHF